MPWSRASQRGSALHYAAKKMKADREIVLAAVRQRRSALQYAAVEIKADTISLRHSTRAHVRRRRSPCHGQVAQGSRHRPAPAPGTGPARPELPDAPGQLEGCRMTSSAPALDTPAGAVPAAAEAHLRPAPSSLAPLYRALFRFVGGARGGGDFRRRPPGPAGAACFVVRAPADTAKAGAIYVRYRG
jgi:hypothetical protein